MKVQKESTGIIIHEIDTTDAELIQSAVLKMAESITDNDHSRRLRRLAIILDKLIR